MSEQLTSSNVSLVAEVAERTRAEAALQEADQRKDQFLATLAHELRNPLSPLLSAAQLLSLEPNSSPETKEMSAIIQSGHLEILKLPNGSIKFLLNVVNESNFHLGEIEGEVHLNNGVAVYKHTDPQFEWMNCTLTITLKNTRAAVSQYGGCGFGTGVDADGTYMKTRDR